MTIAIVENDESELLLLKSMLEKFLKKSEIPFTIHCFNNGLNFISNYSAEYNLVFMDIDMPHINGIETSKLLRKLDKNLVLVFVTKLRKYAVQGYEVSASDFIVKPIDYDSFSAKMNRIIQLVKVDSEPFLLVNTDLGKEKIYLSQIYYVVVHGRYVLLHTLNGDLEMKISMKELEKRLAQENFVRIHYSTMVNLKYLTAVGKSDVAISNGELLAYSRTRKKTLVDAFTLYLR